MDPSGASQNPCIYQGPHSTPASIRGLTPLHRLGCHSFAVSSSGLTAPLDYQGTHNTPPSIRGLTAPRIYHGLQGAHRTPASIMGFKQPLYLPGASQHPSRATVPQHPCIYPGTYLISPIYFVFTVDSRDQPGHKYTHMSRKLVCIQCMFFCRTCQ